jgi:GNAT superfamily N-acetyltransferase
MRYSRALPLIVRPLAQADRAQWEPLWAGYNTFYKRVLSAETTAVTWARFFDPAEPMYALVAEQDGRLLGLVHYLFHNATAFPQPTCYLSDLFTGEAARGLGVGRALIEAVYARAKAAGAARVYWQTHETNHTAQLLYDRIAEKSGFIVYRMPIS